MGQSTLSLHVMGEFRLESPGQEWMLTRGQQRLLALLALNGVTGRSRVVVALWPDYDQIQAMACLRTVVWRLRTCTQAAGAPVVECNAGVIRLGTEMRVDLNELRRQAGREHWGPGSAELACLTQRYFELLPDWDEEWVVLERERVHQMRLHLLEHRVWELCREGSYGAALDAALACVSIDPLRESAYRCVIRVHLAEGNIAEARKAETFCRQNCSSISASPPARPRSASCACCTEKS